MTDPAEIRAEGRRLLADLAAARETIDGDRVEDAKGAWVNFTYQHHDVLLADPPPVGLTEDEREQIETIRLGCYHADGTPKPGSMHKRILLEALDRLEGEVLLDGKRMRLEQVGEYERRATHDDAPLYRLVPVSPSVDPEDPGHCAGPSWAAHEVTEVYEGDTCPSCGTVML